MGAKKKANITEIATASGVSIATISRYFNSPDRVAGKTRERIETAISNLGYQQPAIKQMSVPSAPPLIAAVFPHLQFGFYTEFLNQLIEYGLKKGYYIVPYSSTVSTDDEQLFLNKIIHANLKGIVMLSTRLTASQLESLPVPVITVERSGGRFMQINNDNFSGGKLAAELLTKNGCEVFIHINNDYSTSWPSFKRIVGFECLIEAGQPYERVIAPELTWPMLPEATRKMEEIVDTILRKYPKKKLGVFCSNDDIARLFEQQCILRGLILPKQIELIGYDNSPVSEHAVYPITSIAQNIEQMAQVAVDALCDNYLACETVIPCRLVQKKTTTPRPDFSGEA